MGRFSTHLVPRFAATIVLAATTALLGGQQAQAATPYTALGDSYSSGVGTRSYYSDSGECYRSSYAYPVLAAKQLGARLTFAACSGAKVADVINNQLGSLNSGTRYVTVSVGGNDAGFAKVLTACARAWPYTCWKEIDAANDFIRSTLPGRLDSLYSKISSRAPHATVVVAGYPKLFNGKECNLASRISPGEQAELNKTAVLLRDVTKAQATAHGFGFADTIPPFVGHAVCDSSEWINGLSNPILESYHPNRAGQSSGYTPVVRNQLSAVPAPA
ncbi:MAG: SGNH/GDSL hydrolase family protein [Haloechinothrix sp.]